MQWSEYFLRYSQLQHYRYSVSIGDKSNILSETNISWFLNITMSTFSLYLFIWVPHNEVAHKMVNKGCDRTTVSCNFVKLCTNRSLLKSLPCLTEPFHLYCNGISLYTVLHLDCDRRSYPALICLFSGQLKSLWLKKGKQMCNLSNLYHVH